MSNRTGPADQTGTADRVKDKAESATSQVKDKAANAAAEVRHAGEHLVDEGKEKARELSHRAGERARTRADEEKDRVTGGMRTVAQALRKGSEDLPSDRDQYRPLLNKVADRIDSASGYLDSRDVDALTQDARRFAREHTPLFLGGAFALGVLGARFLKSSADNVRSDEYGGYQGSMGYPGGTGYAGTTGYQADRYDRMLPETGTPSTGAAGSGLTNANSTGTRSMNAAAPTGATAAGRTGDRTSTQRDAVSDSGRRDA